MILSGFEFVFKSVLNPGSRGGIIVGYTEGGNPIYWSQVKNSKELLYSVIKENLSKLSIPVPNTAFEYRRILESPIGEIQINPGLIEKVKAQRRERWINCLNDTIENPTFIFEQNYPGENSERNEVYHFIKTYNDKEKEIYISAMSVKKETREVITHYLKMDDFTKLFKKKIQSSDLVFASTSKSIMKSGEGWKLKAERKASSGDLSIPTHPRYPGLSPEFKNTEFQIASQSFSILKSNAKNKKEDPVSCEKCLEFEGTIAMVFPSETDFVQSPYYGGEDKIANNDIAEVAVWPGKTNAIFGSDMDSWWLCAPVHPNCSHVYEPFDIEELDEDSGDLQEIRDIMAEGFREQFGESFPLAKKIRKSYLPIHQNGIWEECNCASHSEFFSDNETWLNNYIEWKLTILS